MQKNNSEIVLRRVFDTPIFKLLINLILIGLVAYLCSLSYANWNNRSLLNLENKTLQLAKDRTSNLNDQTDYLNSPEFQEQSFKNAGYKLPGETVIDTNLPETRRNEQKPLEFVNLGSTKQLGNFDKWLVCLNIRPFHIIWEDTLSDYVDQNRNDLKNTLQSGNLCQQRGM